MRSAARTVAWGMGLLLAVPLSGLVAPPAPGATVQPDRRAWESLQTISTGDDALRPRVVIGFGGDATAVWEQDGAVWTARQPSGGTWETPTELGKGRSPVVETVGRGKAVVAWRGPRASILFSSARPGHDWKTPVTLSPRIKRSERPSGAAEPQLAVGNYGTVAVVFAFNTARKAGGQRFKVRAAVRPPHGSWRVMDVTDASPSSTDPVVGVDADGDVYVAYEQNGIVTRHKVAGGDWRPPERLSHLGTSPSLCVPGSGRAVAAWLAPQPGGEVPVYAARRLKSGWQAASLVSAPDIVAGELQAGCDERDGASVLWTVDPGGVQVADMSMHGGWDDPVLLTTSSAGGTVGPRLDVGARGPRFATWWRWVDSGGTSQSYVEVAQRVDRFWHPAEQLTPSGADPQTPDVAVDSWTGDALVVWTQPGPDAADPYRIVGDWWRP